MGGGRTILRIGEDMCITALPEICWLRWGGILVACVGVVIAKRYGAVGRVVKPGRQVRRHRQRATNASCAAHRRSRSVAGQQHGTDGRRTDRLGADTQPVYRRLRAAAVRTSVLAGIAILLAVLLMLDTDVSGRWIKIIVKLSLVKGF